MPPANTSTSAASAALQPLDHFGEQGVVGPGQDGQADGPDILLHGRRNDLLGCLAQTGVDDLETGIPQRPRHDLGAPVVAIKPGLGDENPVRGHGAGTLRAHADSSRRRPC